MVEHDLAKVGVAGSTPVSRSILGRLSSSFFKYIKVFIFLNPLSNAVWRFTSQTSPSACGSEKAKQFAFFSGPSGSTPVSRSILNRLSSSFFKYVNVSIFLNPLKLLFFILSTLFSVSLLQAQDIKLKEIYIIDSSIVTLKDLNISNSKIGLLTLKAGRAKWSVPAFRVVAKLKDFGYSCKPPNSSMIIFKLKRKRSFPKLETFLKRRYKEFYPTLTVDSVTIEPTGSSAQNFSLKPECEVRLSQKVFRKKRGTFTVKCNDKRYYFRYSLKGTISVYKANHQIKKDKIIDSKSVRPDKIEFDSFYAPPVVGDIYGRYIARQNIASGKVVTSANAEPLPAVLKNSRVKCFYKEGTVVIEFDALALQNGNIGDTVTVKKSDGKVLKGDVVGKEKVEIK